MDREYSDNTIAIAGVRLTIPDRVLFPEQCVTKRADQFHLDDVGADDAKGWAGYADVRQSLKAASLKAVGVDGA